MSRNLNNDKTSTALVMGELYRSSPRLVTALGAAVAGLVAIATVATIG